MDEAFKTLRGKLEQGDWTTSARWVTEGAAERALDLIEAETKALLSLAYIGDHYFPDLTWKARCEELREDVERLTKAEAERDSLRSAHQAASAERAEVAKQLAVVSNERDTLRGHFEEWVLRARAAERRVNALSAENGRLLEELTQLRRVTQQVAEEPPPVKEDFQ